MRDATVTTRGFKLPFYLNVNSARYLDNEPIYRMCKLVNKFFSCNRDMNMDSISNLSDYAIDKIIKKTFCWILVILVFFSFLFLNAAIWTHIFENSQYSFCFSFELWTIQFRFFFLLLPLFGNMYCKLIISRLCTYKLIYFLRITFKSDQPYNLWTCMIIMYWTKSPLEINI